MGGNLIASWRPLLHPMVVHFPIALVYASVALDWIGYLFNLPGLTRAGFYTLVLGAAGSGVAALTGPDHAGGDATVQSLLLSHQSFALITVALAVGLLLIRFFAADGLAGAGAAVYLMASLGLLAAVTLTGYFGGELIYHHGIGVVTNGPVAGGGGPEGTLLPVKPLVALLGLLTVAAMGAWIFFGNTLAPAAYGVWRQGLRQEREGTHPRLWTLRRVRAEEHGRATLSPAASRVAPR